MLTRDAAFDGVLHFAAFIAAGESVQKPEKYWENNTGGTLRCSTRCAPPASAAWSSPPPRNVYGDPDVVPIPETAAIRPPNPYGASKLAVDHMLSGEAVGARHLAAVSLRYFNVAGALRRPDGR